MAQLAMQIAQAKKGKTGDSDDEESDMGSYYSDSCDDDDF